MAETHIIERSAESTTIRTGGGNGQRTGLPHVLPLLPIRNIVLFPGTVMPLNVGRAKSKALLDEDMPAEKILGVCTRTAPDVEVPIYPYVFTVAVACVSLALFKLPDADLSFIVHWRTRFRLMEAIQSEPFLTGRIEVLEDIVNPGPELDALVA